MPGPPPKTPPKTAAKKGPRTPPSAPPSAPKQSTRKAKKFSVSPWTGKGQGEKVVGYGGSGVGKTTLFSTMPRAIFIGLDDGGRKIKNPITGCPVDHVEGVETFDDVRDALNQTNLWPDGSSVVIDTLTVLESLAEPWMFENIKHEKGQTVSSIEGYGYGKGYTHLYETMRLVLQDLDGLIHRGINVGLICQSAAAKRANPGGLDFLEEGPKLAHPASERNSTRLFVCEWADHVLRIGYLAQHVEGAPDAKVGKMKGDMRRAIFTMPEAHFFAKTRTLTDPLVSFEEAADTSIWQLMFPERPLT